MVFFKSGLSDAFMNPPTMKTQTNNLKELDGSQDWDQNNFVHQKLCV